MNEDKRNSQFLENYLSYSELEKLQERDMKELELETQLEKIILGGNLRTESSKESIAEISRAYYKLGNELVEIGEYPEAVEFFTRSVQLSQRFLRKKAPDAIYNRAITMALLGYPIVALRDLQSIERMRPLKPDVFYVKGQIYESIGRKGMARKMYNKSLQIDPNYWRAQSSLQRRDD